MPTKPNLSYGYGICFRTHPGHSHIYVSLYSFDHEPEADETLSIGGVFCTVDTRDDDGFLYVTLCRNSTPETL